MRSRGNFTGGSNPSLTALDECPDGAFFYLASEDEAVLAVALGIAADSPRGVLEQETMWV